MDSIEHPTPHVKLKDDRMVAAPYLSYKVPFLYLRIPYEHAATETSVHLCVSTTPWVKIKLAKRGVRMAIDF